MNCQETQVLLHGYLDRELDLVQSLEIEHHLSGCPACTQALAAGQSLHAVLRADVPSFAPTPAFRRRLQSALRQAGGGNRLARPRVWTRLAVAAVLLLFVGGVSVSLVFSSLARKPLVDEVVTNHLRSLLAENRLLDIPSSDRHQVKPWLAGKVDFTFPVPDLAERGFKLLGVRLDYLDQHKVAALVYKRKDHIINVFVSPAPGTQNTAPQFLTREGFELAHWRQGQMSYWAISDLDAEAFQQFVALFQH